MTYALRAHSGRTGMDEPAPTPKPRCLRCHAAFEPTIDNGQKFCKSACRVTAWKREKRGVPIGDPLPSLDQLAAERNQLLTELATLTPTLASATGKLTARTNDTRRLRYAADTADTNADKKIGHHGAAIETARHHAEDAEEVASGHRAEVATLRGQVAALEKQLGQARQQAATARPPVNLTLATQVYQSFHRLAKDYREVLRGTDINDDAYRIFDHAARNNDRRKTNTTELDLRTLYHFSRLTQAAFKRAQQKGIADVPTNNAVNLHNTISKLTRIPTTMPSLGAAIQLPATATPKDQP